MHRTILVAFGALSLAGCTTSRVHESASVQSPVQSSEKAQPGTGGSGMSEMCPLAVPGTTVREQDLPDGGALVFTTAQGGSVMDLRRRVAQMADMHNRFVAKHGEMMEHGTGGSAGIDAEHQDMIASMPNAQARVEDLEGGARIVYTPKDPSRVPALRDQLTRHASQMTSGDCPMMKMHRDEMQERHQP